MSLNDQTLEGDYYNVHCLHSNMDTRDKPLETPKKSIKHQDPFEAIANAMVGRLFNKKPLHRRIYESLANTRIGAAYRAIRRRG